MQCGELSRLIIENAGIGYNSTGAALTFPTCGTQPTGYSGRSGQAYFAQPSTSNSNVAERELRLKYDMVPCVPLVLSVPLTNPVTSLGGAAGRQGVVGGRQRQKNKFGKKATDSDHPPGHVIAEPFTLTRKVVHVVEAEHRQLHELPDVPGKGPCGVRKALKVNGDVRRPRVRLFKKKNTQELSAHLRG